MALAAWSMSIIMARWKWATAPATAFRRWNRLTSPGVGGSSAPLPSMVDPGCGTRCAIRDTGAPGEGRYHWTVTVFAETDPVAARRTGELAEAGSRAETALRGSGSGP